MKIFLIILFVIYGFYMVYRMLKDEFVATYSKRQYKTCHRSCYDNYLKYVKEVNQKCMK